MVHVCPSVCFVFSHNKDEHEGDIWTVFKHWLKHLLQLSLNKIVCTVMQVFIRQCTHRFAHAGNWHNHVIWIGCFLGRDEEMIIAALQQWFGTGHLEKGEEKEEEGDDKRMRIMRNKGGSISRTFWTKNNHWPLKSCHLLTQHKSNFYSASPETLKKHCDDADAEKYSEMTEIRFRYIWFHTGQFICSLIGP